MHPQVSWIISRQAALTIVLALFAWMIFSVNAALSVVIGLFNPLWLTVAFVVAVALGNLPFLLVLRNNRLRIARAVEWRAAST